MINNHKNLKILCLQENIKDAFLIAERISGNNLSLPILNNSLLEAKNNFLKISTTDLEMGVEVFVSCKVESEGSLVVSTKTMLDLLNKLPNTKLSIENKNNTLYLNTEGIKTEIPTVNKDDFPIIPKIKNGFEININAQIIKNALEQVQNSVAFMDAKPEISGILFDFKKNILNIVATDSFRLSEKSIINNSSLYKIEESKSFILPQKTAKELVKVLDSDGNLKITIEKGQLSFYFNKVSIISRLIDGDYPDYKQIIPSSYKTILTLNKDEFITKLKLASVFSSNVNDVRFKIDVKNKSFKISSKDSVKGEFLSELEINNLSGDDLEVVFNFKFLLDGLSNIKSNEIKLEFNGSSSPASIKAKKQDDYTYIIMPIRL